MSDDESEPTDGGDDLLAEVPGAELSEKEADEMFAGIRDALVEEDDSKGERPAESSSGEPEADVVELDGPGASDSGERRGKWRRWAGLAAAVALAVGGWLAYRWTRTPGEQRGVDSGIKSPEGRPEVELIPIAGRQGPDGPSVGERLESGAELEAGDQILFRYRLSRPASVALLGADVDAAPEVLWRSSRSRPARESELRSGGKTLSLDPRRYDGRFRLMMVAGTQEELGRLAELADLSVEELHRRCPKCGGDVVSFRAPQSAE